MVSYWQKRKTLNYYRQALAFAKRYVPAGGSILDVGSRDCEYIMWFDWFEKKQALDLKKTPSLEGVISITVDFLDFEVDDPFDLVLCLQVLEHLDRPGAFCKKLLATGQFVIISVPYRWPKGLCARHVQDPVDEDKIFQWIGKPCLDKAVVMDGKLKRLVAVYEGS